MATDTISATSTARELLFVMRAVPADNAAANIRKMGDDVIREQRRIDESASRRRQSDPASAAMKAQADAERRAAQERVRQERASERERTNLERERIRRLKQEVADRLREERNQQREAQRMIRETERAQQRADRQKSIDAQRAANARLEAERKANQEIEREEDRLHRRSRLRQLDRARRNRMTRETAAEASAQAIEMAKTGNATALDKGNADVLKSVKDIKEEFKDLTDGVLRLSKGYALLGLLGERETDKLIQGLVKLQGVTYLAKGGIQVWTALSAAVEAYERGMKAATAAQIAFNLVNGTPGPNSGRPASAAGGVVGSGLSGWAGAMLGRVGLRTSGSAAASGAASLASTLTPSMAAMITSSQGANAAGLSGAAAGVASQYAAANGGAAAPASMGILGAGVPAAAWAAAIFGSLAGGNAIFEFGANQYSQATGGGDREGWASKLVADNVWIPAIDKATGLFGVDYYGNRGASKAASQREAMLAAKSRREMVAAARLDNTLERSRMREDSAGIRSSLKASRELTLAPDAFTTNAEAADRTLSDLRFQLAGSRNLQSRAALESQVTAAEDARFANMLTVTDSRGPTRESLANEDRQKFVRKELRTLTASLDGNLGEEDRARAMERIRDLERQRVNLLDEAAQIARDEGKSRMEAGRDAIRNLETEKRERMELIRAQENSLKSARERFGEMDPSQQITAISGQQKLTQADAAERAGNIGLASQLRGMVTKAERDVLRGLGLQSVDEGVNKVAGEIGTRAGFDRYFGAPEQKTIGDNQATVRKIEANIQAINQLTVNVELDTKKLVEDISNRAGEKLKIAMVGVKDDLERRLNQKLIEVDRLVAQLKGRTDGALR